MSSSFGQVFRISTWGESHGTGVGVVIDGCPSLVPVTEEDIQRELDRRRPGQSDIVTPRREEDRAEILSGVLDGKTLGDIYLGKIKKWDDEAIAKLNPGLKLPAQNIAVVRRADGSGTSFVFTSYLAKVNEEWKSKVGSGSTVNWPTGLGGKGNDGIAAFVQRLPGAVGYVEYAYAKQNNLAYTKLISADGKPVSPTEENFANAAKGADWSKTFAQDLTNQKGEDAWPITSTTFILIHKDQKKPEQGTEVLKFFDWAYKTGAKQANDLDYASLPDSVVEQVRAAWKTNIKDSSGKPLY